MTDFEKLQIAKQHNKKLSIEIGILQSENAELEYLIKQDPKKARLKKLSEEVKSLRKTNRDLILKVISTKPTKGITFKD